MDKLWIILLLCILCSNVYAVEIPPEPASGFKSKPVIEAKQYMVVSAHKLASQAGDEIIRNGGNAIDAAIATEMVLNLVEPQASGIGGGGFLLYYDKNTGKVEAYDGRETAPQAATSDMFLDKKGEPPPYLEALKGGLSVGTPGLLRMLENVHKQHGKLPWKTLFEPAINLAEKGFSLSDRLYKVIASAPYIITSSEARVLYFNQDGSIKPVGTIIKNPIFADTLRQIAKGGADVFYQGNIAKSIVTIVHNNPFHPGRLSEKDLANYQSVERQAICTNYRDYKLCGMPPPTSGSLTVLQSLKLLGRFDLKKLKYNSPEAVHLIMEAERLAFADRNKYVADCDFIPVPVTGMLSPEYVKQRSLLINSDKALQNVQPGEISWDKSCGKINPAHEHSSTSHMSIVDNEGNAVSMTSSIEYSFGSALMVKGFFLNNELTDFSLKPEINGEKVANHIEPGKRPRSSMAPMLVFNHQGLYMLIGSPGGSRIISYVLQTIVSVLDWHIPLNDAINQPHYATTGNEIELEQGTSAINQFSAALNKLGHKVIISDLTSGLHGIEIKDHRLFSGVDARREGAAVGQ